jgi:hypothetical protein
MTTYQAIMHLIENLIRKVAPIAQPNQTPFSQSRVTSIPSSPLVPEAQKSSTPCVSFASTLIHDSSPKKFQQACSIQSSPKKVKSPSASNYHPSSPSDDLLTSEFTSGRPATINVPKVSSLSKDIQKSKITKNSPKRPNLEKNRAPIQSRYPIVIAKAIGTFLQREIEGKAEKTKLDQDTLNFIQNHISCFEEVVQPFGNCLSFKIIFFGYGKLTKAERDHAEIGQLVKMPRKSEEITKRLEEGFNEFFKRQNFAKWLRNYGE